MIACLFSCPNYPICNAHAPHYIVICGLYGCNKFFPHYLIKCTIFGEIIEIKFVLIVQACLKNISLQEEYSETLLQKRISLLVKYWVFLSDFNETWMFWTDFQKSPPIKYYENLSSGNWVVPPWQRDRGTDGRTDVARVIVPFRNFNFAPNKCNVPVAWGNFSASRKNNIT
jgi:hypothetical protein